MGDVEWGRPAAEEERQAGWGEQQVKMGGLGGLGVGVVVVVVLVKCQISLQV